MQATRLPRKGKCTLAPLVDQYVRLRIARGEFNERTARTARYILHDFAASFGGRNLNRLTVDAIDQWFAGMGGIAKNTRRVRLSAVTMFCRWLYAGKRIKADPTVGYPKVQVRRGEPVTVPNEHVGMLLALSDDRRMHAMVWLMVGLGYRCIEVANVNVEGYNARERIITVIGKNDKRRTLPVDEPVAEALDAYLAEVGRVAGPLIRSKRKGGARLSEKTVSHYMSRWMSKAGIKARSYDGISAHALRRTCATDVMEKSRDIEAVSQMLGHESIETTMIYVPRSKIERLREVMSGRSYSPSSPKLTVVPDAPLPDDSDGLAS